jgi:hypothetical protein
MPVGDGHFIGIQGTVEDLFEAEYYQQDIDSPNHMQIDSNDFNDGQNERDEDLAIIDSEGEPIPKANDCEYIQPLSKEATDFC